MTFDLSREMTRNNLGNRCRCSFESHGWSAQSWMRASFFIIIAIEWSSKNKFSW